MDFYRYFFQNTTFEIMTCKRERVGPQEKTRVKMPIYDWNSDESKPFKDLHMHRLYMVESGAAVMKTRGGPVRLEEGKAYFIPADSILSTSCAGFLDHHYIHFNMQSAVSNFFALCKPETSCEINFEISFCFREITSLFQDKPELSFLKMQGYLFLLLSYFIQNKEINPDIARFIGVLTYIDANFEKKITLGGLASIMSMNPTYFSNIFARTFEIPPIQFLIRKRLSVSQQLLTGTNLSVKEISEKCGFDDQLYFSKCFHKNIGLSPNDYRLYLRRN